MYAYMCLCTYLRTQITRSQIMRLDNDNNNDNTNNNNINNSNDNNDHHPKRGGGAEEGGRGAVRAHT